MGKYNYLFIGFALTTGIMFIVITVAIILSNRSPVEVPASIGMYCRVTLTEGSRIWAPDLDDCITPVPSPTP